MSDLVRARGDLVDAAALTATYTSPEQVARRWLTEARSPNTHDAYRRDVVANTGPVPAFLQWCALLRIDPWTVDRATFALWLRSLDEYHPTPATLRRKVSAVRRFYAYAAEVAEVIPHSPIPESNRHLHLGATPDESATRGLTRDEASAMLRAAHARSPLDAAVLAVLYHQGLRASELCGLDLADVTHDQGHRAITVRGKGRKRRTQALAHPAARAVDAWLTYRAEQGMLDLGLALVGDATAAAPLFVNGKGLRLNRYRVRDLVALAARDAGVPEPRTVTPHVFRHTCTTHLLDPKIGNVPLRDVQVFLGHASSRTTEAYDRRRRHLDDSPAYRLPGLDTGP